MTMVGVLAADGLPLGLNPLLLGAQIINFLVLWFILSRFVFPIIFKTLDERTTTIREGIENAERARNELANAQQQADTIIQAAQTRSQQIIAEGTANGERVRAKIEEDAHTRADEIARQGQQRIRQEEAQAKNQLRQQVANLAIDAAGRVIGESLDGPRQRKLVEDFVAQSPEGLK